MSRKNWAICFCLLIAAAGRLLLSTDDEWKISYRKVQSFTGTIIIVVGTDSCYYESNTGSYKNPTIVSWRAGRSSLSGIYKQVQAYKLSGYSPVPVSVGVEPSEQLELLQNGRLLFALQKSQLSTKDIVKFEIIVAMLKSFAAAEKGWKY